MNTVIGHLHPLVGHVGIGQLQQREEVGDGILLDSLEEGEVCCVGFFLVLAASDGVVDQNWEAGVAAKSSTGVVVVELLFLFL